MTITVFGATGLVGKHIVQQALAQGHSVRAFGRNVSALIDEDERTNQLEAIQGFVFDAGDVLNAVEGADAVISVLGGGFDGTDKTRSLGIKNILTQIQKAGVQRIVALGGLGVLDAADGTYLLDDPNYPAEYLPVGKEHLQAYLYLKESTSDWVFVCSPDIKNADASGNYAVSVTHAPNPNKYFINAGDLAELLLREATNPTHHRERLGVTAV